MIIIFLVVKINVKEQKHVFKVLPFFLLQDSLVPQKDTPTGGCPGNERDVRVDCGRSADGSEVHVPESNGGDVGRGTVEFNLRG